MPKRDSLVLLNDICTALGRISSYVQGMDKDSFLNDQKTIDAQGTIVLYLKLRERKCK